MTDAPGVKDSSNSGVLLAYEPSVLLQSPYGGVLSGGEDERSGKVRRRSKASRHIEGGCFTHGKTILVKEPGRRKRAIGLAEKTERPERRGRGDSLKGSDEGDEDEHHSVRLEHDPTIYLGLLGRRRLEGVCRHAVVLLDVIMEAGSRRGRRHAWLG